MGDILHRNLFHFPAKSNSSTWNKCIQSFFPAFDRICRRNYQYSAARGERRKKEVPIARHGVGGGGEGGQGMTGILVRGPGDDRHFSERARG